MSLHKVQGDKMKLLVNDGQTNRHKAILAFVNEEQGVIAERGCEIYF